MILVYNLSIRLYILAVRLVSLWNKKAKEWLEGRKNLFSSLEQQLAGHKRIIWMHCSSAGEFEQGKPLLEQLKYHYPEHKILVSFFSPSGYNTATAYKHADLITYLPLDTRKNARRFLELVQPELVIFVKYEFWYHHLSAVAFRHIPLLLVSGVFREDQVFFKSYGKFYRQVLFLFRHLFVQDSTSLQLLKKQGIDHCSISGDTRFDRVQEIARQFTDLPIIEEFISNKEVIVAGSTWSDDEQLLSSCPGVKLILAPHEINEPHLVQIETLFKDAVRYSQWKTASKTSKTSRVLIVDNVGMLSRLYRYATIAYVGGGFTRDGIHNILEAAVYGKPVLFGPNYQKYREAKELLEVGGAFSLSNATDLQEKTGCLLNDPLQLEKASGAARNYVEENTGATQKVLTFIQEKRLLTK